MKDAIYIRCCNQIEWNLLSSFEKIESFGSLYTWNSFIFIADWLTDYFYQLFKVVALVNTRPKLNVNATFILPFERHFSALLSLDLSGVSNLAPPSFRLFWTRWNLQAPFWLVIPSLIRKVFSKWGSNGYSWKVPSQYFDSLPANIYLFKPNKRNTRKRCEICSKLTLKTLERHQWRFTLFHTFF